MAFSLLFELEPPLFHFANYVAGPAYKSHTKSYFTHYAAARKIGTKLQPTLAQYQIIYGTYVEKRNNLPPIFFLIFLDFTSISLYLFMYPKKKKINF